MPLAPVEPQPLDGVELGAEGRQRHQGDVVGHDLGAGAVPAGLDEREHGLGLRGGLSRQLGQEAAHGGGDAGRHERHLGACSGLDGGKEVGGGQTSVAQGLAGAGRGSASGRWGGPSGPPGPRPRTTARCACPGWPPVTPPRPRRAPLLEGVLRLDVGPRVAGPRVFVLRASAVSAPATGWPGAAARPSAERSPRPERAASTRRGRGEPDQARRARVA